MFLRKHQLTNLNFNVWKIIALTPDISARDLNEHKKQTNGLEVIFLFVGIAAGISFAVAAILLLVLLVISRFSVLVCFGFRECSDLLLVFLNAFLLLRQADERT